MAFADDAANLFNSLENESRALSDPEYTAKVIDAGIAESRRLLAAGSVADAEQLYLDTRIRLERAKASKAGEPLALQLLWVELAYLVFLLLIGYLTRRWPDHWLWNGFITLHSATAWFGALGGVTVGLYGLYSHVQARDFDSKYKLWYICKPIMGAIFGWFVFLVYYVGFIAVQGDAKVTNDLVLYVISFLAGFSERFTIRIIDRMMQVLTTWEDKTGSASTASVKAKP